MRLTSLPTERRECPTNRTARLFALLNFLSSGRTLSSQTLSELLSVSRRTIFRDIAALRRSGMEITASTDREGLHLEHNPIRRFPTLTRQETLAVLLSCAAAGDSRHGIPYQNAARTAALKLGAHARDRFGEAFARLTDAVLIRLSERCGVGGDATLYNAVILAIERLHRLRIRYRDNHRQRLLTTVLSPYRLVFQFSDWRVVGRSSVHRATHVFCLDDIADFALLDDHFIVPPRFRVDRFLPTATTLDRPKATNPLMQRYQSGPESRGPRRGTST